MPIPSNVIWKKLLQTIYCSYTGSMSCHPILLELYHSMILMGTVHPWCCKIFDRGLNLIRNSDTAGKYAMKSDNNLCSKVQE